MGIRAEAIWVSWSGLIVRVRVRNRFRLSVTAAIDSAGGTVTVGVRDNVKSFCSVTARKRREICEEWSRV